MEFVQVRQWKGRVVAREQPIARRIYRLPAHFLLLVAASLTAGLVLIVPGYLLVRVIGSEAALDTLLSPRLLETAINTLLLTAAVTAASAALAVPLAWLTTCTDLPLRRLWAVLAALPLVIPSYVAAYLYASLFSPKGILQQFLSPLTGVERLPSLYGFSGSFLVLTLISYPLIFLSVRAALLRLDPALLEAARSLGMSPRRAFRRVTLPSLRPALAAGSLLVALYCLRDFGAVNLFQYGTFTRAIYNRYQVYRPDAAATLALTLVAITILFLFLEHRSRGKAGYARLSVGAARRPRPIRLGRWKWPALLFAGSVVFMALVVPAAGLLYWFIRGLASAQEATGQANVVSWQLLLRPAWNSLLASLLAAGLTLALGLPVALLATRYSGRAGRLLEHVAYLGYALPGVVVALAYVFVGVNYVRPLYQTLPMLLAAYVVLFLPQAVGAERASLLQVSRSLEEAGRSLGKRPWTVFRQITLPLVRPGILAAAALVFLTCMKELPTTLMLSPIGFNTLPAQIWANITEAFFARAAMPTLLLVLLSSAPLAIFTLRDGREK